MLQADQKVVDPLNKSESTKKKKKKNYCGLKSVGADGSTEKENKWVP